MLEEGNVLDLGFKIGIREDGVDKKCSECSNPSRLIGLVTAKAAARPGISPSSPS